MRFKTLLFDIDDTLLDFDANENQALARLFASLGIELTPQVKAEYKAFNQSLWKKLELGQISRDELMAHRFATFFKEHFNLNVGNELNKRYLGYLAEGHQEISGAKQLLQNLQLAGHELYVVTNGVKFVQEKRIADAKLRPYFKNIYISEEIGYQKPARQFFKHVFADIGKVDLDKTAIIGDSLSSDIKGAVNSGISSIWFNPKQVKAKGITPNYQVTSLTEIEKIV